MTQKKLSATGEIENTTDTNLVILKSLEKAFYNKHPKALRRNTAKSMKWFSQFTPRSRNRARTSQLMRDKSLQTKRIVPGQMLFFEYDAVGKATLPVWDRFPLVFMWDTWRSEKGKQLAIGINLHYLPPRLRFIAMQQLMKLKTEKRFRRNTRLKLSWEVLQGLAGSKLYEHSVKIYRVDHIRTNFIKIPASSWELAAFLPMARWQNGSKKLAWKI